MKGAIFFSTRYGSTARYAQWIGEACGLPVFDMDKASADPAEYDFLILGGPIIYHKLMCHKWLKRHQTTIMSRPTILFSVSGAGAGPKLDAWMAASLAPELIAHVDHVALRGRQNPKELGRYDRVMLIIGGLFNPDPVASKDELKGFDFMDKSSIAPILDKAAKLQAAG